MNFFSVICSSFLRLKVKTLIGHLPIYLLHHLLKMFLLTSFYQPTIPYIRIDLYHFGNSRKTQQKWQFCVNAIVKLFSKHSVLVLSLVQVSSSLDFSEIFNMSYRNNDSRIYVGNLPPDIRSKDIEDLFYKFGKINFIDLKNRRGPPFAFVEFEDARDAEDAVNARDGYDYDGYRLRVEFPRGTAPGRGFQPRGRGRGPPARRSQYRVIVTGLPPTGSWQDLKDHMREAGDVCYADVYKDGTGVVEFLRYEDMKYAVKKLDDSRFRSHEGEVAYVQVKEDGGGRSRSRSRSYSPRRTRGSPTYSPARRSRSRSRSHSRSRSISRSRSRSN